MGFSYKQIFGYLLGTDEGYIIEWEHSNLDRGRCSGNEIEQEYFAHRNDFLVFTMANFRYWFTPEQVEEGYRGLYQNNRSHNQDEEVRKICRRVRKKIHRLTYIPETDNKLERDLMNIIQLLDNMYEKI
ncbi:hypothetical protein [Acaryochloris marina]|uniref:hypothetical protein n=1 Tax=Acaryochloris marina TaxID=155978 RepID=UPI0021C2F276|nr:hypothetical protein [Acaryochloris marina]BDM83910.1 hypothetical protein AM10699_67710 [Acaryochloris marina MBIC10699]